MKAVRIRVEYGKNGKYVNCNWVAENAIEEYKAHWIKRIRERGWTKDINFRENTGGYCEIDDNGTGLIAAFTLEGLRYDVKVK